MKLHKQLSKEEIVICSDQGTYLKLNKSEYLSLIFILIKQLIARK